MKTKAQLSLVILTTIFVLYLFITCPPCINTKTLDYQLVAINTNNIQYNVCLCLISNSSNSTIFYMTAGYDINDQPLCSWNVLSNGVWLVKYDFSVTHHHLLLRPHEFVKYEADLPKNFTKLKIGLDITSLTWRGRLGWDIYQSRFSSAGLPLALFLFQADYKKRSKIEWSREYDVK